MINNILELQNVEKLTLASNELQGRNRATRNPQKTNSETEAVSVNVSELTTSEINKAIAKEDITFMRI